MSKIAAVIFCSILSVALLGVWVFQRTMSAVPSAQSAPERKPAPPAQSAPERKPAPPPRQIVKIALVSWL